MEVKNWTYEEFPDFDEEVEGAHVIETTGNERGVAYLHDVEYANVKGTPLHLQILVPYSRNDRFDFMGEQENMSLPCIVFVQGSAWFQQYVYGNVGNISRLAMRGYVCAIVEYRHSGIASFPAQAVDTCNAIRFLRKNAKRFGIDPDSMIVSGDSSGGHTAVWAGL
ncbi:MAG: alpha/beta hydrolase, partial [Parasporobacterium sp.]|nr:alpha/beta hydrolase [Parasporobacterium sp.]